MALWDCLKPRVSDIKGHLGSDVPLLPKWRCVLVDYDGQNGKTCFLSRKRTAYSWKLFFTGRLNIEC